MSLPGKQFPEDDADDTDGGDLKACRPAEDGRTLSWSELRRRCRLPGWMSATTCADEDEEPGVGARQWPSRFDTASTRTASSRTAWRRRLCMPCWLITCILAIVALIPISITVGFFERTRDFSCGMSVTNPPESLANRTLYLQIDLIDVDVAEGTAVFEWDITGDDCSELECPIIDFFFDDHVIRRKGPLWAFDFPPPHNLPLHPLFVFNSSANSRSLVGGASSFRTHINLFVDRVKPTKRFSERNTLENYPFDSYSTVVSFYAQERGTGNFPDFNLALAEGVAVGYTVTSCNLGFSSVSDIAFTISRASLVKAYDIIIVIAQWLITLVLFAMMIKSVLFGHAQRVEVLVIPVTTLFAFTQLRSTMPGAPPFGTILDFVSILPCLAILVVSTTLTLLVFLIRDPEKSREAARKRADSIFPRSESTINLPDGVC